jgi:hypothetical protein
MVLEFRRDLSLAVPANLNEYRWRMLIYPLQLCFTAIVHVEGRNLHLVKNKKGISTLILIVLMLCSLVVGALISYVWVLSAYYNMPEETTSLWAENAVFDKYNATYFNVTVLNPSNSALDVNVTGIRLIGEADNSVVNINTTNPQVPFQIKKGTKQTFKCLSNWGKFAGRFVTVKPVAGNISTTGYTTIAPLVLMRITPTFDVSKSVQYFNLSVENHGGSVINLTVSDILIFGTSIKANVTPTLPSVVQPNNFTRFTCNYNWDNLRGQNVTITVKTAEGYEAVNTTRNLLGAVLYVDKIEFPNTKTDSFNVTLRSTADSTMNSIIKKINVTLHDGTTISANCPALLLQSTAAVAKNSSKTFNCLWNWSQYRNENITINAYAKEGFNIPDKWAITPPSVVWNITDFKFDLDDTGHFLVNVTNMPISLRSMDIIKVKLNETQGTVFTTLAPGEQKTINCTLDWKNLRGKNVTLTVVPQIEANISRVVSIPSVQLKLLGDQPAYGDLRSHYPNVTIPIPLRYVNVTIANSANSLSDVNVTRIILETGGTTYEIDKNLTSPLISAGYVLKIGENVTIICQWNWENLGSTLKITVYTKEGTKTSRTWETHP